MAKIEFRLGKVYPPYTYDADGGEGTNDFSVYSIDKCVDGITSHWGAIDVMTTKEDAERIVDTLNEAHSGDEGTQKESSLYRYLLARRDGGPGWIKQYEDENLQDYSIAMICGHYWFLLDQLVSLVGQGNCEILARGDEAISKRVRVEGGYEQR